MPPHRRHDYFERAAEYAARRPGYPPALAGWLAEVSPARRGAWDAGCGSGQLSVLLAERFAEVVATDATPAQLAHARAHARVRYAAATAEQAPLRSASIDLAVAAQAAHWFDLPRYFAEVRRVTRGAAVVALVTYGVARVDDARADAVVRRFYHEVAGPHWPPERRLVEEGYASIDFPFGAIAAPAFTMQAEWSVEEMLGYVGTWSAVRRLERSGGAAQVAAFEAELRPVWGAGKRAVTWPLTVRAGRVHPQRKQGEQ